MSGHDLAFVPSEHHIELASGRYLDLVQPDPAVITLEDVAHGLSNTCRFAGQARRFYSVAEHAVLVAARLRSQGYAPIVQMCGLHHDDTEAFIGDVTRPLKALLPGYSDIERRLATAIAQALGLPDAFLLNLHHAVKAADDWALAAEAHHLLRSKGATWFCANLYDPGDLSVPWADDLGRYPVRAEQMWLGRHLLLTGEILEAPAA